MFHDHNISSAAENNRMLSELGTGTLAYMRPITSEEIRSAFPEMRDLADGATYWALFAADGTPLILASEREEITSSAFHNNLRAILPN